MQRLDQALVYAETIGEGHASLLSESVTLSALHRANVELNDRVVLSKYLRYEMSTFRRELVLWEVNRNERFIKADGRSYFLQTEVTQVVLAKKQMSDVNLAKHQPLGDQRRSDGT